MFALSDLSNHNNITIQCHDNPDVDTIASAFALYSYFKHIGIFAKIIYSGKFEITKANLLEMILRLEIPLEYVNAENIKYGTLVIADGQYGAGNVRKFEADTVVVIDHHMEEQPQFDMGIIAGLGSCSTVVWDLLRKEGFPFDKYPEVSTALYYGLYTDTGGLSEIYHPLDKDMRDDVVYSRSIIKKLQNTNLSINELFVAGAALTRYTTNDSLRYAIFKAEPCDPNILGFISDLALQVDSIDACIVYNHLPDGTKLSIRCCTREIMASDFAAFLTKGVGYGGGHIDKAGGFISKAKVENPDEYISVKAQEYFNSYDIVDSASHNLNIDDMKRYKKLKIPVGCAFSTDMFENGTPIMIRALEGDEYISASEDILLMVGVIGEVWPINREKFNRSYTFCSAGIDTSKYSYPPTARNRVTGEVKEISDFIKACVATGEVHIYARQLKRDTKVFNNWNTDGYMYGGPGDYIAIRSDDHNDVYLIKNDIFHMTYEEVSS